MSKKVKHQINIYGDLSVKLNINHKWVKQLLSPLSWADKELLRTIHFTRVTRNKLNIKIKTRTRNEYNFDVTYTKKGISGKVMREFRKHLLSLPFKPIDPMIAFGERVKRPQVKNPRDLYNIPEEISVLNAALNSKNHTATLSKQIWQNALGIDNDGQRNWEMGTSRLLHGYSVRTVYCKHYSWTIITTELVNALTKIIGTDRACDLGCGTAYLSTLLQHRMVDVTAYDNRNGTYIHHKHNKTVVLDEDYQFADLSGYKYIILSWPNYDENMAAKLLDNLTENQVLLYCGEGQGGCNADNEFFYKLQMQFEELDEITQVLGNAALSFSGIHDRWSAYRRVRGKDYVYYKDRKYRISGTKLNLVYVETLNDNFQPINYCGGSYDKAVLLKGLWTSKWD